MKKRKINKKRREGKRSVVKKKSKTKG